MPIVFILTLFDESRATVRKFIRCQRTHEVGLSTWDIAEVVAVFCHDFDGIRIILIVGLWNQGALHATDIAADALAVVDACNLQDSQVVVDAEPTAVSTTLWQRPRVR